MWRDYKKCVPCENDGFEIFIGDQEKPEFWNDFFKQVGMIDIF